MAGIPASCMAAGRLLNELPPDAATSMIDITMEGVAEDISAAHAALAAEAHSGVAGDLQAALEAVRAAVTTDRQSQAQACPPQQPISGTRSSVAQSTEDPRWRAAKAVLQETMPDQDYSTWIAPLMLLHAEDRLVVVGTPNCFVRSEIQHTYAAALQEALEQAWGRAVAVELVIDTPVSV